jgi:thioredoxin 1
MELHLNDQNFEAEVLNYTAGPVLVDFYASWCGPCQIMSPIIENLAGQLAGTEFKVFKVDVEASPATAGKYDIMSIPTLIVFKNGQPVETMMGIQSEEVLKEKLNSHK